MSSPAAAASVPALAPAAAAAPPKPARAGRRRSPAKRLLPILAFLLLVGAAYGLAKAGVLPVAKWAGKNPAAQKALGALGLAGKPKARPASATAAKPAEAAVPSNTPPAAPAATPLTPSLPAAAASTSETRQPPKDNAGRLARILATMEPQKVAGLFSRMPDAEVAPLVLKMKESTAGEILSALPAARAVALTRYLRRYQQP